VPRISLKRGDFPSARKDDWEETWRNAAMGAMGYAPSMTGMKKYIADIKARYGAQHAFAVFVTKYPVVWFGYEWGKPPGDGLQNGWLGDRQLQSRPGPRDRTRLRLPGRVRVERLRLHFALRSLPDPERQLPALCRALRAVPDVPEHAGGLRLTRGHLGWNELAVQSRGTTTLKATWTFDFDAGVAGPPGGATSGGGRSTP